MKKLLVAMVVLLATTISSFAQIIPLGPRFVFPYQTAVDSTGVPIPGALLNFYASGTNTRLTTYSDPLLTIPNSNPVVANAAGVFPNIFLNGDYKVVLTDSSLNQLWTADPFYGVNPSLTPTPSNFAAVAPLLVAFPSGVVTYSIVNGTSVANPGTGTLEDLVPVQTNTANGSGCTTSCNFATVDLWKRTRRSNSGSAMTDSLPAASATGMTNGTRIEIKNVDASAIDTISAGAGTTIIGGASFALSAGRDLELTYDAPNTTWRAEANTDTAALISTVNTFSQQQTFGAGIAVTENGGIGAAGNIWSQSSVLGFTDYGTGYQWNNSTNTTAEMFLTDTGNLSVHGAILSPTISNPAFTGSSIFQGPAAFQQTASFGAPLYNGSGFPVCDIGYYNAYGLIATNASVAFAHCINNFGMTAYGAGVIISGPGTFCANGNVATVTATISSVTHPSAGLYYATLTVTNVSSGLVTLGQIASGTSITGTPRLNALANPNNSFTGTGGTGTYQITSTTSIATVSSEAITLTWPASIDLPPYVQAALVGIGQVGTTFANCNGANITEVLVESPSDRIENFQALGLNSTTALYPAIWITGPATLMHGVIASYGTFPIRVDGGDLHADYYGANYGFGSASLYVTTGFWTYDARIDMGAPGAEGCTSFPNAVAAWAASTDYTVGACVKDHSGLWVLQAVACASSCESATSGTGPAVPFSYGAQYTDNQVTWELYSPVNYFGAQFDTIPACCGEAQVFKMDLSGPYYASLGMTNSGNALPPTHEKFSGLVNSAPILLFAGNEVEITQSEIGNLVDINGTVGVSIVNNDVFGSGQFGVNSPNVTITANVAYAISADFIDVGANSSRVTASANTLYSPAGKCLSVAAGTSGYIRFFGNDCAGTAVTMLGTGGHNYIPQGSNQ